MTAPSITDDRPRVTIGTAGHIDHGKTALVRALTGVDTDRLPEERSRGITIDLGFARLETLGAVVSIVDVPGHERFIRNMVAGAAGVDGAVLVVAADDGVMPQTVEHLAILELLGIRRAAVALTKCDLVDDELAGLAELDIAELLAESGFAGAPILRTSARTGLGIDELRDAIARLALQLARAGQERAAADAEPDAESSRLAIDRVFVKPGLGTIVTGTLRSGVVTPGDAMEIQPGGREVRVRGVQVHGESVERACAGERVAMHLGGVHHTELERGHEVASPGLLEPTRVLTVSLRTLQGAHRAIRHRDRIRVHAGTQEVVAAVRLLEGLRIEPGQAGLAQLICHEPVVATGQQAFIVRSMSPVHTIGGGRVLLVSPYRPRRDDRGATASLRELAKGDADARAERVVVHAGDRGVDAMGLVREAGIGSAQARSLIDRLGRRGVVVDRPGDGARVMHVDAVEALGSRVLRALRSLHSGPPARRAVPRALLEQRLGYIEPRLLWWIVDRLASAGRVRLSSETVAFQDGMPGLTPDQELARERVESAFRQGGFTPPSAESLVAELGLDDRLVRDAVRTLGEEGVLVHVGGGIHLHAVHTAEMHKRVARAMASEGPLTVARVRDLLGTSRKFAVPLCEHLDRVGITKRRGDVRVPGPHAPGAGSP